MSLGRGEEREEKGREGRASRLKFSSRVPEKISGSVPGRSIRFAKLSFATRRTRRDSRRRGEELKLQLVHQPRPATMLIRLLLLPAIYSLSTVSAAAVQLPFASSSDATSVHVEQQPDAQGPRDWPHSKLPWGEVNIISTTDTYVQTYTTLSTPLNDGRNRETDNRTASFPSRPTRTSFSLQTWLAHGTSTT